jgi:Cu2+-exporting ATPase
MATALAVHSLHPVSRALVQAATQADSRDDVAQWTCDSVVEVAGQGVRGLVGDAGEVRLGSATFCGVAKDAAQTVQVHLADARGWVASFSLEEIVRPEAQQAVQTLLADGLAVQMLSGDGLASVQRIASLVGIPQAQGGCTPADKLHVLQTLQSQGRKVAMVGDGLNDGPVLAGAHVSFAFGQAVPLAQAQADFVVMGDTLHSVVQSIRLARDTMGVVRQNLWWALIYNVACVPLAVVGWLPAWLAGLGMATSSLVVVLNALRLSKKMPPLTLLAHQES